MLSKYLPLPTKKIHSSYSFNLRINNYWEHIAVAVNLIRDALGMTSDRLYEWRLLLEEYRPKIVYIKGIHNTVADTISWLEYDPSIN
jgi:hypothetical protein